MRHSAEYGVWVGIKKRCLCKTDKMFGCYGGRGIQVCESWLDFVNFYSDMGPRPPGMQIDRIDNDGNYEPSNCRWATRKENCNNRRSNIVIEYKNEKMTVRQWEEKLGFNKDTLLLRLRKGWPIERALTKPVRKRGCKK